MKVIFAGTPDFAAVALAALLETDHDIVAVYTQPDRKAGRGQKLTPSPVKQLALEHHIPVYQPLHFKSSTPEGLEAQQQLAALDADVMVVAAYGLILPQAVLDMPKHGCLNIHGSLLPRWRGAAPIQRAIQAGDAETGVTIMQMAAGLDTGDMLYKTFCPIESTDTSATLYEKLSQQGATAICKVLESELSLESFLHTRQVQDENAAVYAHKLTKLEARIQWSLSAQDIDRMIRAFNPWPMAYIALDDNTNLRVHQAKLSEYSIQTGLLGEIISINNQGVHVVCSEGIICLSSIQWPGGKALNAEQVLQSQKLEIGQILS